MNSWWHHWNGLFNRRTRRHPGAFRRQRGIVHRHARQWNELESALRAEADLARIPLPRRVHNRTLEALLLAGQRPRPARDHRSLWRPVFWSGLAAVVVLSFILRPTSETPAIMRADDQAALASGRAMPSLSVMEQSIHTRVPTPAPRDERTPTAEELLAEFGAMAADTQRAAAALLRRVPFRTPAIEDEGESASPPR